MPILSFRGAWPDPSQWDPINTSKLIEVRNAMSERVRAVASEENIQVFNDSVQAVLASIAGQEVWIAFDRHTTSFAAEPRYVPETEWDFNLDEIISEASYILSDERADTELADAEPFAMILDGLRQADLVVIRDGNVLFDSFASERHFERAIVRAIEEWDMREGAQPR